MSLYGLRELLSNDKVLLTIVLIILLLFWLFTKEPALIRMIDSFSGAVIALVTQRLIKKGTS